MQSRNLQISFPNSTENTLDLQISIHKSQLQNDVFQKLQMLTGIWDIKFNDVNYHILLYYFNSYLLFVCITYIYLLLSFIYLCHCFYLCYLSYCSGFEIHDCSVVFVCHPRALCFILLKSIQCLNLLSFFINIQCLMCLVLIPHHGEK